MGFIHNNVGNVCVLMWFTSVYLRFEMKVGNFNYENLERFTRADGGIRAACRPPIYHGGQALVDLS